MNVFPVIKYLLGLGVFGFFYWLLDGILSMFIEVGEHTVGTTFNIMHALWTGALLIYLIFGGWYTLRKYNERNPYGGFY